MCSMTPPPSALSHLVSVAGRDSPDHDSPALLLSAHLAFIGTNQMHHKSLVIHSIFCCGSVMVNQVLGVFLHPGFGCLCCWLISPDAFRALPFSLYDKPSRPTFCLSSSLSSTTILIYCVAEINIICYCLSFSSCPPTNTHTHKHSASHQQEPSSQL